MPKYSDLPSESHGVQMLVDLLRKQTLDRWLDAVFSARFFFVPDKIAQGRGKLLVPGRGVPSGSPNPNPISDQNMPFHCPTILL